MDDSIVRGTTSRQIIQMAREAGANKVYFASAAPPVRYPNVYGIGMPIETDLVAFGRNTLEICGEIGADYLIFQKLEDLIDAVREGNPRISQFEGSCFTGKYVTEGVTKEYLDSLKVSRGQSISREQNHSLDLTELSSYISS